MKSIDNLSSMVVFARVVETMSFTEAAKSLQLSKSSVSREITQLETRLGVQLLIRSTRKITVTDVGFGYYQHCSGVLNEVKKAEKFVQHLHEEPVGNLRVVAPVNFGCECVVPVLNQMVKSNIHTQVEVDLTDRPVDMEETQFHIAIVTSNGTPDHPYATHLTDISWGLYATPHYLSRFQNIDSPEDLPRYDYILFGGRAHTTSLPFRKNKQKMDIEVRSRFRANNSVAVLNSALAGTGIAYLPDYITQKALHTGELVRLLPEWTMDILKVWVLYKKEQALSPRIRSFIEQLNRQMEHTRIDP
ncbi:LysR family transcriptional regulator [Vibrio sonorensis]|uniref:LysR family transcriptional regulator n=1 Tax=Vibrio sonorensis TaxID=1004316 RepID=UPI0008DB03B9|nr:LysR family transcriptional regulator [Vibrio sonorensis]